MSRTRKQPYSGKAQKVSKGCRCHGSCSYCYGNRMYSTIKRRRAAEEELEEGYEPDSGK